MDKVENTPSFSSAQIRTLKGHSSVRERPAMYIGDVRDGTGLHNLVYEVAENAIEQSITADAVIVTLNPDSSVTVQDSGISPIKNATMELVGGLAFVGVMVANALSASFKLRTWCNGNEYVAEYREGDAVTPLSASGLAGERRGTEITFLPDAKIFSTVDFDLARLETGLSELVSKYRHTPITLIDKRGATEQRVELRP